MLNEGILVNTSKILVKSEMLKVLWNLEEATPDAWERAVFEALTGQKREEVAWDFEDNQAGYHTWIKSFDDLIQELIDDGFVKDVSRNGERFLTATECDPTLEFSYAAYPSR
jgi:hypothetical protein